MAVQDAAPCRHTARSAVFCLVIDVADPGYARRRASAQCRFGSTHNWQRKRAGLAGLCCSLRTERYLEIAGHIDRADDQMVEGWIHCRATPGHRFVLQVFAGSKLLGETAADQFRQDLQDAGLGDGHCAFSFRLPGLVPRDMLRDIRLRVVNSKVFLLPEADTNHGTLEEADAAPPPAAEMRSRPEGLWIDRPDWLDRMADKHRRGELSGEMSTSIFRFVRDGYLVIRNAVPTATVAALNEEIERTWQNPPEGLLMETFEPDDQQHLCPPDIRHREGRTKLLDMYAHSATARRVIASPTVVAFLAAIFDDTPKAFQGLTLWNGLQQTMQKDSAFVQIEQNPRAFAAAWVALEDVKPGTGELEYYIGSHLSPDFLFGGVSKWMEGFAADQARFAQSLHDDAVTYGQTKGSFLAKRGDVLLWHADLAHADAAITKTQASRRSMLTHFTPARENPIYYRRARRQESNAGICVFASQHADIL